MPPQASCTGTGAPWTAAPLPGEPRPAAAVCVPQSSDHYVHQIPFPGQMLDILMSNQIMRVLISPASLPRGPNIPAATLSCDSAASTPCVRREATPPLPRTSTKTGSRAAPVAAADLLAPAVASRAAGVEVASRQSWWEPLQPHFLLQLHSSAEDQKHFAPLLRLAAPAGH